MEPALPQLHDLIAARLAVVRQLAESLEAGQSALLRNDAEMIARGATHQAELCRRWSWLETQLRREEERGSDPTNHISENQRKREHFEDEWIRLQTRIRHLARVHASLLKHLNRSLAVLARAAESCAPTYTPAAGLHRVAARSQAGD